MDKKILGQSVDLTVINENHGEKRYFLRDLLCSDVQITYLVNSGK